MQNQPSLNLFVRIEVILHVCTWTSHPPLLQLTSPSRLAPSAARLPSWRRGSGPSQPEQRWPVTSWAEWWPATERTGPPCWGGGSHFYYCTAVQTHTGTVCSHGEFYDLHAVDKAGWEMQFTWCTSAWRKGSGISATDLDFQKYLA